jgi:hypothetical protein
VAAWSLTGFTVLVLVAALVLAGLNASRMGVSRSTVYGFVALAVVVYAGAGGLIVSRVRRNAIGWLLGLIGLSLASVALAEQYALYGVATAPGSLFAARLAGWSAGVLASLTVLLLLLVVLLFPDGRLPSRLWRPLLWAMTVVAVGAAAQQLQAGTVTGVTNVLVDAKAAYPNPVGILPLHGWLGGVLSVIFGLAVIIVALVVASVFARRHGASAELRRQLAWLGYVGVLTALWVVVMFISALATNDDAGWFGDLTWFSLEMTPVVGIPLACAVAVLKYRLYDIDRIISRTLAYAIITGLLVGVYTGLVLLATQVVRLSSPVAVAAATLAVAALFNPVRRRVQRKVDRRFNRARYDADQTVAAFAAGLKDAVNLNSVRDDLASTVSKALEPAHVSVWVSQRD